MLWIYLGKSLYRLLVPDPILFLASESNQLCGIRVTRLVVFSYSRSVLQVDHSRKIYLSLDEVFLSALGLINDGQEDCSSIPWEVVSGEKKKGEIWKCGSCYVTVSFCLVGPKEGLSESKTGFRCVYGYNVSPA